MKAYDIDSMREDLKSVCLIGCCTFCIINEKFRINNCDFDKMTDEEIIRIHREILKIASTEARKLFKEIGKNISDAIKDDNEGKNIVPESLLVKAKEKYQGGKWVEGYYAFMDPDHIVTSKDGQTLYFVDPTTVEPLNKAKIDKAKEKICDEYCKYPGKVEREEDLWKDNSPCIECPLTGI
ncbi:MAG: hypothetical protein ACLUU0_06450 [Anaerostipes hadrus]